MGATSHDLHIDALRSEMAMGYRPQGFIADMIFPMVQVDKQSDLYTIFSRATRLRRQETKRAPGNEAQRIDEPVSSSAYHANNYALKAAVTIEDRSNADPVFVDQIIDGRTRLILDHLMLDWELRIAPQVTSATNVGSGTAVGSAWNANVTGTSDPVGDLNTAIDNVQDTTGVRPNRMVFGLEAWKSFRRHVDVRDLIMGVNNGGGFATREQAKALFEIDDLMVAGAYQNTGAEFGDGSAFDAGESLSQIWGDDVLVYYAPPAPSREVPSLGYSFRWSAPGLPNMQVERHPFNSRTHSEEVEVGYYQDELITGVGYGFLVEAVNSAT